MPSTPEPPAHIAIKVKVPPGYLSTTDNSSGADSFVRGNAVPVTASVGDLRQQIQSLIPTHPPPERQRLLYGGRALVDNEQRLGDAFNTRRDPTQTEYVVHLLVKGEQDARNAGPAHRRAVSTPPAPTNPSGVPPNRPLNQLYQQVPPGANPLPIPGTQFVPGQQAFPQIIARNQQLRADMGMQGVGGRQAQGQGQPQLSAQAGQPSATEQSGHQAQQNGQTTGQSENGAQTGGGGQPQQGHQHHHHHIPGRPISGQGFHMHGVGPNGQQFQVHHQMMQFPIGCGGGMPGQMPFGFPAMRMPGMGFPQPNHMHGPLLPQQQQQDGPSALERARENMVGMRRALDSMRNQDHATEEQRRLIGDIRQRVESLNEYLDPLSMDTANGVANGQRPAASENATSANRSGLPPPFQQGLPPLHNAPRRPMVPVPYVHHRVQPPSNPSEVTAYLLSSPQGPQALLFSPQHGTYTGSFGQNARLQPTPAVATNQQPQQPGQQQQQGQDPVAQAAHRVAQDLQVQHAQLHAAQANQQAQGGQAQEDGPLQAPMGHFWLLMRVLIFAYFFLGSNMGWQRPLALAAVGFGFWMIRAGMLGDGAAVRRWWEGVVGVEPARQAQGRGAGAQQGQQGAQAQQQNGAQQPAANAAAQRGAMPTPEQVAQRLLNQQADRNQ